MSEVPPHLKVRARALRSGATDAERRLWSLLRTYRPRFTRQLVVGGLILDFACRKARLAIEVDGGQHSDDSRDARRTAALEAAGWRVIRFWNNEVLQNSDGVMEMILAAVAERVPTEEAHPRPLPEIREGRVRRLRSREPSSPPGFPGGD